MHEAQKDAGYTGMTSGQRMRLQRGGSMADTYRRAWGYSSPMMTDTMTYGTGAPGDKSVAVTGNVTGQGKLAIEINAGSSLLDVVKRAEAAISLAGTIGSNGPGSTGRSSPDAAAPSPRGNTGRAAGPV